MSDPITRPTSETPSPAPSLPGPPPAQNDDGERRQTPREIIAYLKRNADQLSEQRKQMLASLPPLEIQEGLYRKRLDQDTMSVDEWLVFVKQDIESTRLPPELREEILASLPPPEEEERLYRELIENGGLSSEEFFKSLGLEYEP